MVNNGLLDGENTSQGFVELERNKAAIESASHTIDDQLQYNSIITNNNNSASDDKAQQWQLADQFFQLANKHHMLLSANPPPGRKNAEYTSSSSSSSSDLTSTTTLQMYTNNTSNAQRKRLFKLLLQSGEFDKEVKQYAKQQNIIVTGNAKQSCSNSGSINSNNQQQQGGRSRAGIKVHYINSQSELDAVRNEAENRESIDETQSNVDDLS